MGAVVSSGAQAFCRLTAVLRTAQGQLWETQERFTPPFGNLEDLGPGCDAVRIPMLSHQAALIPIRPTLIRPVALYELDRDDALGNRPRP